ncbi:TPA: flagellar filament capping protein FliD [Yersinia enterocolitica]|uniref:Flagellar hook-associated protein 2 n=2 Tax=Yersinia enterocolitica (type O:9) TaxID=34055 RepID=F4N5V0_YEREN|nr:flagellar filament capping protein FliD [Yersinia enterocolitica]CAM82836.1 putative flagellar hook-associated protein [Yersinia enterocolitica W22703]ADZ43761.1 Putative flagellar hook-associated protein [Yersinia enterocolitica subsp. palearctica 105.5R(r)]AJJ25951.1 flagellar hook-associated family protein [Yersinia enterocolitica]ALG77480.1 flagellar hook protein [Yersinia enterocolitica]KGA62006.1 flagellar hook-associated family protein [Yersinia enterocolitica]
MAIDVESLSNQVTKGLFAKRKEKQHKLEQQLKTQQAALDKQKSGLTAFRTALKDLGKVEEGLLKNKTSTSIKEVATVSANEKALKGNYSFFVEQLASAHQLAYTGLTDTAVKAEQGPLDLTVNGESFSVELKKVETLADLAHAINNAKDNPGVTASVVRSNGQQILLLTSDKSGAANKIEFSGNSPAIFSGNSPKLLSSAQDSVVYIGDPSQNLKIESSSNTLDKVIDGVTIELTKAQKAGDPLLEIKVEVEPAQTETQIKKFIDAFNGAKSAVGSNNSDSLSTALKQNLNSLVGKVYGGKTLGMIGVSFDRNGDLKLDSKKLTEVLKTSPTLITDLMSGSDGLIKKLDKALDPYLNASDGSLKMRSEMLATRKISLERNKEGLENSYARVLKTNLLKFNRLNEMIDKMDSTMNMFNEQARF